jgi:hypothetical protein
MRSDLQKVLTGARRVKGIRAAARVDENAEAQMERPARDWGGSLRGPFLENRPSERVGDHQAVIPRVPAASGGLARICHDHDPREDIALARMHPAE